MARSKQSRKGKKEWRRNISTAEHDAFLDKHGRDERSGGPLHNIPSESIFFVDKSKGGLNSPWITCLLNPPSTGILPLQEAKP